MERTEITDDQIRAINARAMQAIAADKDARIDDLQRALDAERAVNQQQSAQLVHWQLQASDLRAQLATIQAQLAQPIRVCQGCGRVSREAR